MSPLLQMFGVFVVLWILGTAWSLRGVLWLQRGSYARARRVFERQRHARSPSVRDSASYNVALCAMEEGRFEEALLTLEPLHADDITPPVRRIARNLTASTLLLLGRDPARAARLLAESQDKLLARTRCLQQAYAALLLADRDAATRYLDEADRMPARSVQLGMVFVFASKRAEETTNHALCGMIAELRGEHELAIREYGKALATGSPGAYAARARDALARMRQSYRR